MTCEMEESQFTLTRWLELAKFCGQEDPYLGKRQSVRFKWRAYVQVEVQHLDGSVEYLYATTKDVSEGGLGLVFRRPVPPRAKIRVQLDDENQFGIVSGTVMHCTQTVGSYFVGMCCDDAIAA